MSATVRTVYFDADWFFIQQILHLVCIRLYLSKRTIFALRQRNLQLKQHSWHEFRLVLCRALRVCTTCVPRLRSGVRGLAGKSVLSGLRNVDRSEVLDLHEQHG